ncbi:hypothetical protein ACB092_08G137000 [Castanea dentata]
MLVFHIAKMLLIKPTYHPHIQSCLSQNSSSLILLIFVLFQTVSVVPTHYCLSSKNFTSNNHYETNLKDLMSYILTSYETPPSGFALGSRGHAVMVKIEHMGIALCPGDTSVTDCMSCVADVTSKILTLCPNTRGAVMWNKFCMLKYFDKDFVGQIENQTRYEIMDSQNAKDPIKFGQKIEDLLSKLARIAFVTPRMHGRSTIKLAESEQLYLLAQCTRDLTS